MPGPRWSLRNRPDHCSIRCCGVRPYQRVRLTLADWSRGPGETENWLIADRGEGLVVDADGQARDGPAAIAMPGPVVVAASGEAGVACLGTEDGLSAGLATRG